MKRHLSLILVAFMSIPLFTVAAIARTIPEDSGLKPSFTKVTPAGTWEIERSGILPEGESPENKTLASRVFFVHAENIPENVSSVSYGGALNLKYFSGLSYDYLQRSLPGKTFGLKVNIPKSAVSDFSPIPNKLRVTLKADRNGVWTEFFEGKEWTNVKSEGSYEFNLKIPSEAVTNPHGEMYSPEDTILLAVEYYLMEGAKRHSSVTFSISDVGIEGIDIDPTDLEWQFIVDGHAKQNVFLPSFPKGSDLIYNMGQSADLKFVPSSPSEGLTPHSGELKNFFLTVPVYIPRELRFTKGSAELTVKSRDGLTVRSSVKNFDSCNIEGRVHLTVPLDPFSVNDSIEELFDSTEITCRLTTKQPHAKNMMPFVIEPITARKGELIPFDNKWRLHDIQGLGGYKKVDVNPNCEIGEGGAAAAPFTDSYQRTFAARMKGGIDWADNPYYKVELVRDLEDAPMDMDNTHFDVMISPLTDTEEYWQKPFRARLGLIDMNGNVMFGPNVSLSEGLSATASLDVSVTNPMPKGFVSQGFDPKRIRSVVLNFEASHSPTEIKNIKLQLLNLSMGPREFGRPSPVKMIDYGRLPAGNPELWHLNSVIKEDGGFSVGINYPFPVIDVPYDVMAVPQIYPPVGMKVTDPQHLGFASKDTRKAALKDFTIFAEHDLCLVRLLLLGHLEGVFTWDEKGFDITGFLANDPSLVQEMAGMSVEKLAEFLSANEETIFAKSDEGNIPGLEEHVLEDLRTLLDVTEEVEKTTGKRLNLIICIYDFLLGDGTDQEGPLRAYKVGEHPEAVLDPSIKVKVQALVWKMLKEWSRDERFSRYISIMEIMNEPGNATVLSTKKDFNDLLNFVGEGLYLAKDALGPEIPVSVGFRSWPADLRFWAPIARGLDLLMIHYWESLESYNINVPGLWPLNMNVSKLWEYLGEKPEGRLTGMGEIGPKEPLKKNLFDIEKGGYDFCLIWSYSGHDSYNAKDMMDKIADYQKGNKLAAKLLSFPEEKLKKAFRYMIAARNVYESELGSGKENNVPMAQADAGFAQYLDTKAPMLKDKELKSVLDSIIELSNLKGITLSRINTRFILFESLRKKRSLGR